MHQLGIINKSNPDITILEPFEKDGVIISGALVMEVKKDAGELYRKDGTFVHNEHIYDQAERLRHLRQRGYHAIFVCGADQAIDVIDAYMRGKKLVDPNPITEKQ